MPELKLLFLQMAVILTAARLMSAPLLERILPPWSRRGNWYHDAYA